MRFISPLPILTGCIFIICTNCINNIEDISNTPNINPNDISYSMDIQPIFTGSCGGSGCHINSSTNGVNLSSYSSTVNSVGSRYGTNIVIAGDPNSSPLVDKIEPNPEFGSRMPLNNSFLTPVEIEKIKAWISGGAEDN